MTAFSRAEHGGAEFTLIWELRSVNHRYLDISIKLPDDLRRLEPECRARIAGKLARGRVDAGLKVERRTDWSQPVDLDREAAQGVLRALEQIQRMAPGLRPASALDILGWRGVVREPETAGGPVVETALSVLDAALDELRRSRGREGRRLAAVSREKIKQCGAIAAALRARFPEIQGKIRSKWEQRLDELSTRAEPERLAQEVALLLTKTDIAEELDRLDVHLEESRGLLAASRPAGRRLDFLLQELNREANTIGSKSADQETTHAAIELKVLLDQIREQVQNLE